MGGVKVSWIVDSNCEVAVTVGAPDSLSELWEKVSWASVGERRRFPEVSKA